MANHPNFVIIAEHLDAIKDEVALIPNIVPLTADTFRQEVQQILGTFMAASFVKGTSRSTLYQSPFAPAPHNPSYSLTTKYIPPCSSHY